MESRTVKTEIAILKFYQSFHIILVFLIILCHILSVNKYLMIFKSLLMIFCLSLFVYLLNFGFLVISTILLFTKKSNPSLINFFRKIAFSFIFFSIIKGIALTIIFWINYYFFPKFIENCPFNFSTDKINKLIKISQTKRLSKICNLRRCIFYNYSNEDGSDKYHYLCNFNAELYSKSNNIKCHYAYYRDYSSFSKFFYYLEKCYDYDNYYECSSQENKHEKFFVQYNKKCPKKFDKKRYIALGILFPFIDLLADIIIWLFIYTQYKRIIKFINFESFLFITRFSPSSLNSTKDSSIIKPNNNINILTQININQYEMIIYTFINNNNIDKKIIKNELKINLEKNSLSDSKCDFIDKKDNIITNDSI